MLQLIQYTFVNRATSEPYVDFLIGVYAANSSAPLRIYHDVAGSKLLSALGQVPTDSTGSIRVWAPQALTYELILSNKISGAVLDRITVAGISATDYESSTQFSESEVASIRDLLAGGTVSSVWGAITGTLSDQTDLQAALNAKVTLSSPVTLTGATTLNRSAHGNRQIIFNGADATLTIASDAAGGWTNADAVEVHTLAGSSGVPTIATPDGKTLAGSATKIIGATRKGVDVWTTGTTDPAADVGSSEWGGITGTLADQTDLQAALDTKPTIHTPVTLTGATTLNRAAHGNRQIIFNGSSATLTVASDAAGGWLTDDNVEVHTSTGSSGVPTISTPDGKTVVGSATRIIRAERKGTDSWTTEGAATAGAATWGSITGTLSDQTDLNTALGGLTTSIALKAPLASPALTGTPTAPTAAPGTNTTQVATTAFVTAATAAGSTWGSITGTLSAQTDLQTALDTKPTLNSPVTLTGTTTLNRATHGNRQIIFNGASATLTVASDAAGGWVTDDTVEVHTAAGSTGVPTVATPDGKTVTGSATKIVGATRKATDSWTTGTTDPSAGSGSATLPDLFTGQGFLYAAARGSTAPTATGAGGQSAVGTAASSSGATVAGITFPNRHRITVSIGAVNTNAYCGSPSGSEAIVVPNVAADATARARGTFIPGDGTSACRTFFGMNVATPVATVEPSTFINCAGFGADSTDTQLFFMSNDGSGSVTKIALNGGTGFPANSALADVYQWYVEIVGGTTRSLNYYIKNLVTGVTITGSTTTAADIPAAASALRAMQYRNTAANAVTAFFEYGSYAGGQWALFGPTS